MDPAADLLAEVVDQLPVGVFVLGRDERVLVWNAAAERLTGWDRQTMLGRSPAEARFDPPTVARVMDELRAGRPFAGRLPARPDPALPTLYFRAVPTRVGLLGVLQDVADTRAGDEAFALLDALWESAPVGLAYFDTDLRYRRVNGAVLAIDGGTADQRIGQTLEAIHGETGARIAAHLRGTLDDGQPRVDVPMVGRLWHGQGPPQEWRIGFYPVRDPAGRLLGGGVVISDVTVAERTRRELADALNSFQSLVEATSAAVWVREVDGTSVRDAPGLRAITGQGADQLRGWGFLDPVYPAHRGAWRAAFEDAVAEAAVFTHEYRLRTASGAYRWFRTRAAPLRTDGRVTQWVGTETDVEDTVRARVRRDVLAQATFAMNAASEPDAELLALADATVPAVTDVCRVYLVDRMRAGGTVTGRRSLVRAAPDVPAPPSGDTRFVFAPGHPVSRCVATVAPVLAALPPDGSWRQSPAMGRWTLDSAAHSALLAPVLVGGTVVAVLVLVGCGDRPAYTVDDLGVAGELGVRASAALERATTHQQNRQVAVALQDAMLSTPPQVPGFQIEARYLPAAAGLAVGGDWFDAFVLPGGDLALGVGDVAGHDVAAAATMGQLRSMLRALADGTGPPSQVVAGLDRVATRLAVTGFTTLVHGHLRRNAGGGAVFRWSNAGHPPPVLVPAGGPPRFLDGPVDVVLGVVPDSPRHDAEVELEPGATLLLHTDGLTERRHDPDDRAGAELLQLVADCATRPLDQLCDHLVRHTTADTDDDVVVLAVRVS